MLLKLSLLGRSFSTVLAVSLEVRDLIEGLEKELEVTKIKKKRRKIIFLMVDYLTRNAVINNIIREL